MSGRRVPHAAIAALITYGVIFGATQVAGWARVWDTLTVPSMVPAFADLRMVTGVQKTLDLHLDPRLDDPGDPWNRPFNYPGIWIAISTGLHWTPDDTVWVGLLFVAAFIAGLALLHTVIRTPTDSILLYAAAVTPAALFAVERGNVDLFVFFVVCVAIALYRQPWLQAGALVAAGVLKLYPAFGLAAPNRGAGGGDRRLPRIAGLVCMVVYVFLIRGELSSVRRGTTASRVYSYGVANLSNVINSAVRLPVPLPLVAAVALAGGTMIAGVVGGIMLRSRARAESDGRNGIDAQAQACLIAAAIYVGSYWLRSNYDYRLLFVLPAVPYLNTLRRSSASAVGWLGAIGLASLLGAMSQTALVAVLGRAGFALNLGAKLALVGAFCAVAAFTVTRPAAQKPQTDLIPNS
jgi:hypothetical protein